MPVFKDFDPFGDKKNDPKFVEEINKKAREAEPLVGPSDMQMVQLLDEEGEPEKPSKDKKDSGK
jgi:hypothetical protein